MKRNVFLFVAMSLSASALLGQFKKIPQQPTTPSSKNQVIDISELKSLYKGADFSSQQKTLSDLKSIDESALTFNKFRVVGYNEEHMPTAIKGTLALQARQGKDLNNQAHEYLESTKRFTFIADPSQEMVLRGISTDDFGNSHLRFDQQYNGVKIYGSEVLLHTTRDKIDFLNGRWKKSLQKFNTKPTIDAQSAINQLVENEKFIPILDPMGILGSRDPVAELVIYYHNDQPFLAHHITAYPDNLHRWEYFVDAQTGAIINKYMNGCKLHNHVSTSDKEDATESLNAKESTSKETGVEYFGDGHLAMQGVDLLGVTRSVNSLEASGVRYLIDVNRPMFQAASSLPDDPEGTIWTIDAFNTSPQKKSFNYDHVKTNETTWKNPSAVSAQYNGSKAYEYFRDVHGRNSINGGGGNIVSLIDVADEDGKTMGNAFWNGAAMFYGNGDAGFFPLARGLDVAGHEMTHGVVQSTANLEYEGESGALNESFADVFGTMIDRDDWKIGEDVVKAASFPSGALRDLSDPHNKAALNDYGSGFQPKILSEKYKGTEDNGGVHLNSGIPNYAFFLFASDPAVGKDKAEKVYYRALSQYLTKSSQFIDAKVAVVKAATDLYGTSVAAIAETAFNNVGITGGTSGGSGGGQVPGEQYQTDIKVNPGADLIMASNGDQTDIYMFDPQVNFIFNPNLSNSDPLSKPSVTDDGSEIVFIAQDGILHNITVDYVAKTKTEQVLLEDITFRNVVISRDGRRLALLREELNPEVTIIDLGIGKSTVVTLRNPTTAAGISTGDVQYADAMEFDPSGEYLMYDAYNEINSPTAGSISYWDINFVKVWELDNNNFTSGDAILFDKLFSGLPEGVDVGNPTFAKNSDYIVAFDYLEDGDNLILGANIETGDVDVIAENNTLGYPTYSKDDKIILYDALGATSSKIKSTNIKDTKIAAVDVKGSDYIDDAKWAVWFSNGVRVLTGVEDQLQSIGLQLSPNPTTSELNVSLHFDGSQAVGISIFDVSGKLVKSISQKAQSGSNVFAIQVEDLVSGIYTLKLAIGDKVFAKQFAKN